MAVAYPIVSWANGSNVYEVNVRQYTAEGTLGAFMPHVGRLKNMGVDILWLMPLTPVGVEKRQGSLGSYYAASCYTELCSTYGSAEDLKQLVRIAHQYGMKVIIDWVANHTAYDHHWVKEHPEWYKKDEQGNFIEEHGWVDVIDLDYRNQELRSEMIRSMKHWITTFDIDGFRCDMAHLVPVDFWVNARCQCDAIKPLFWLAETEDVTYHEVFDASYSWEWMHASEKVIKGEMHLQEAVGILQRYAHYPIGSRKLLFTTNHDENTWNGTEYEKYRHAAKALAVFSCTFPGLPLVYSGQEIPNHKRLPFFEKDVIDWSAENTLHDFYKSMLELRKENLALQESASVLFLNTTRNDCILAYLCRRQQDKVLVMINMRETPIVFHIGHPALAGQYINLFSGETVTVGTEMNLSLEGGGFRVLFFKQVNKFI